MTHTPVLLEESLGCWITDPAGFYVDLTIGGGGHCEALLRRFPDARCLAVDRDSLAIEAARRRLAPWWNRVDFFHGNFAELPRTLLNGAASGGLAGALASARAGRVNGALADLGVSTHQLLDAGLGLSYQKDEPLDMRLGSDDSCPSAAEILAANSVADNARLLVGYGDFSPGLAHRLARACRNRRIMTSGALVRALSPVTTHRGVWARVFQALRMEVNREEENLRRLINTAAEFLAPGGRLLIISFHSVEDRLVKHAFRAGPWKVLTAKPVRPCVEEVRNNPRARSAKLRAAEKGASPL